MLHKAAGATAQLLTARHALAAQNAADLQNVTKKMTCTEIR
jgi:high-affinity nickel permease